MEIALVRHTEVGRNGITPSGLILADHAAEQLKKLRI